MGKKAIKRQELSWATFSWVVLWKSQFKDRIQHKTSGECAEIVSLSTYMTFFLGRDSHGLGRQCTSEAHSFLPLALGYLY